MNLRNRAEVKYGNSRRHQKVWLRRGAVKTPYHLMQNNTSLQPIFSYSNILSFMKSIGMKAIPESSFSYDKVMEVDLLDGKHLDIIKNIS